MLLELNQCVLGPTVMSQRVRPIKKRWWMLGRLWSAAKISWKRKREMKLGKPTIWMRMGSM